MQTAATDPVVLFGILQPDGTVRLDHPPTMPAGPVQITIRPIDQRERLPDLPVDDSSVPPPLDLPRLRFTRVVQLIRLAERLPDPLESVEVA
jgi:hypothetical protein